MASSRDVVASTSTRAFQRREWHMGAVYLEDLLTTEEAIAKIEPTRRLLLDLALQGIDAPDAKAAREVLRDAVHERDWHDRRAWQHVLTMKSRLPFDDYGGVDTETLREEVFARRYADADTIPLAVAGAILFGAWSPKMWPLMGEHLVNHIRANVDELREQLPDPQPVYSHRGFEGWSRGTRW